MTFQKTVRLESGLGVPGEILLHGPLRAGAYILQSSNPASNVVARAFTFVDGSPGMVQAGGSGEFAGILANPKVYPYRGTVLDSGAATDRLTLPNGAVGEFVEMGYILALTDVSAKIGDQVVYSTTSGVLSTIAAGASPSGARKLVPNATVARFAQTNEEGGLIVIRLTN